MRRPQNQFTVAKTFVIASKQTTFANLYVHKPTIFCVRVFWEFVLFKASATRREYEHAIMPNTAPNFRIIVRHAIVFGF
jgi:hypothetical protein